MTTTRPGAAAGPARSPTPARDEFPALGSVVAVEPLSRRGMGPAPHVHLGDQVAGGPDLPADHSRTLPSATELTPGLTAAEPAAPAEHLRVGAVEWRPVDPQTARAVLRPEREVEIPRGRHHRRRPRPARLSSGDATERMQRLVSIDRRRRAIMVAAAIMIVVVLMSAIWRYANTGFAADEPATSWNQVERPDTTATVSTSPSGSVPTSAGTDRSSPSDSATTAEGTAQAATGPQVPDVLKANAIYGSAITGACPPVATPTTADDARAALSAYVDCMNSVWGPVIDSVGTRFRPAGISFYVGTVVTACTTLNPTDPVSATYCPIDATIYVSPSGVSSMMGSRFFGSELVTHEYAHHVQSLSQILAAAGEQGWSDNEYSRRVQLQAHCLSFAVLTHVGGFAPDVSAFRMGWQATPGNATYGSTASIQYWGEKGLSAATVGACDTFSVSPDLVA